MINDKKNKPYSVSRRFGADIKTKNNFFKNVFSAITVVFIDYFIIRFFFLF